MRDVTSGFYSKLLRQGAHIYVIVPNFFFLQTIHYNRTSYQLDGGSGWVGERLYIAAQIDKNREQMGGCLFTQSRCMTNIIYSTKLACTKNKADILLLVKINHGEMTLKFDNLIQYLQTNIIHRPSCHTLLS